MQHTSTKLFSFFFTLFFISSCNNKPSHNDALEYYSNLMLQTHKMHEEAKNFMINSAGVEQSIMSSLLQSTLHDSSKPTNLGLIDSLKKLYDHLSITLDSIVKNLEPVKEIDKQINLKLKAITYVNQTRQFWEKFFQNSLKTFNQSELASDQSSTKKLSMDLAKQDLDVTRTNLLSSALKFETVYKITQEELKKYGL